MKLSNAYMVASLLNGQHAAMEASNAAEHERLKYNLAGELADMHPSFLNRSPDGRSIRQAEKSAAKQEAKDRRRAFRHSVDKQNKIASSRDVRKTNQQIELSKLTEEQLG